MRKGALLLAFCLCLLTFESITQTTRFTHLTTADGLSQNSVVDIIQDGYGFMWIATQDGLNRYDGTEFKTFPYYFRDVTRSTYSQLGQLICDEDNNIWFTSLEGHLLKFDQQAEKAEVIIDQLDVSTILLGDQDTLIGTFGEGIWKLENGKTEKLGLGNLDIFIINEENTNYHIGTNKGTWVADNTSLDWKTWIPELENKPVSKILNLDNKSLIATYGSGLLSVQSNNEIQPIKGLPEDLIIQDIIKDGRTNSTWVATYGNGIYKLSQKGEIVSHYLHNPNDQFSINYNDILSLAIDKQGNIWMGTDGGGISIWNNNINLIGGISKGQSNELYPVDVARALTTDSQDRLWIGTSGKGLTCLDQNRQPSLHYTSEPIEKDRIVSLLDQGNYLLVGTQGAGLRIYEYRRSQFIKDVLPSQTIWDMHDLPNSENILLATRSEGILLGNPSLEQWTSISLISNNLTDNNIRVISDYKNDKVFLGTEHGNIWILNTSTQEYSKLELKKGSFGPIKSILYIPETQTLWIGTQRAGLIAYNLATQEQYTIDRTNGLVNNTVYAILPDSDNNLWISTNKGLMALQTNSLWENYNYKVIHQITTKNGLYSNEFNTGASYIDNAGNLYFGGIDGVNWINPSEFKFRPELQSEVSIIQLNSISRDKVDFYRLTDINKLILSPIERNFNIQFGTINFGNEGSFQYRLEGIQDTWIDNGINNTAHFTNIPPGDYVFEVRWMPTGYSDSQPKSTTLDIHIKNPWWSTPLATVMWLILLFGILYSIYKIRTNIIRRETEQKYEFEKQVGEMELQLLRTQMNPHFMFNSLNAIKNYILKSEPRLASEYLSNFAHLIRMILQNSREKTISLDEELETLLLYIELEQLRFKEGFQFTSEVESNIQLSSIQVPPMILQPYIENAIWHGLLHKDGERHLSLNIRQNNEAILIEIKDNGIGIEAAQQQRSKSATRYKSMGMGITKSRIDITNKLNNMGIEIQINDLSNGSTVASGTQVQLQFPIQNHYKSA